MPKLNGFIGPSSVSFSPQQDCQRTVNFYLEPGSKSAKNQAALYPSPGFSTFTSVSSIGGRALYEMNQTCLGVLGATAYMIPSIGTPTAIGAVAVDGNLAQIVSNGAVGAQFLFASGSNGYCYTPATSAFTQVLTGDCTMIGMLDTVGIALDPVTSSFRVSNQNDFTTWNPIQFAQRGDAPDNWAAMVVNIPDIWLIGQQTGVVWYDAGTFPLQFAQRPGATFKYGIAAPWTLKTSSGFVLWLSHNEAGDGIVVMAVGYTPQRVSTYEVENAIRGYNRTVGIGDAEALMFQYSGHSFYVLTFPAANATWVYDITTGVWVEWGKWSSPMTSYGFWAPRVHCHAFGQHLTAERTTGVISVMDSAFTTESDGSVIRRMRITPSTFNENRQFPHRRVEVLLEPGLGTQTGQGQSPKITMSASNDGGKTYLPERTASGGAIGAYGTRAYWLNNGISRNRAYKFVMSDPISWRLIDGFVNNDQPIQ